MKVLLISTNIAKSPFPVYPLGMSVIANAIHKSKHTVYQLDIQTLQHNGQELAAEVKKINPDIIGISIRNIDNTNMQNEKRYIDIVKDVVKKLKSIKPDIKIILGGSGFSILPKEIIATTQADYGIVGEGEKLLIDFLDKAEKNIYPKTKIIHPSSLLKNDEILLPLYEKSIIEYYLQFGKILTLQTKRGCPYKCAYCSYPYLEGKKVRPINPEHICDKIEMGIDQYNAKFIFFAESVFNDEQGFYLDLLKVMKRRKINIPWTAFFRPKGINKNIVELLKETGLAAVELGSDAPSNTTLKALQKPFTFEDVLQTNNLFAEFEIPVAHYFMFGLPQETEKTVLDGIDNINQLKNAISFIFTGIRIFPKTPLYQIAIDENIISKKDNLLTPVYYVSKNIDLQKVNQQLHAAFDHNQNTMILSDSDDFKLEMLHKMGHVGIGWDLMLQKRRGIKRNGKSKKPR